MKSAFALAAVLLVGAGAGAATADFSGPDPVAISSTGQSIGRLKAEPIVAASVANAHADGEARGSHKAAREVPPVTEVTTNFTTTTVAAADEPGPGVGTNIYVDPGTDPYSGSYDSSGSQWGPGYTIPGGSGYPTTCADGSTSNSGGRPGACSWHG